MNAASLSANPLVPAQFRARLAAHTQMTPPPVDEPALDDGQGGPTDELVVEEPLNDPADALRADVAALRAQLAEMQTPAPATPEQARAKQFDDRVAGAMSDADYDKQFGDDEPTTTLALIRRENQANNARLTAQFAAALDALEDRFAAMVDQFAKVEKTAKDTTVSAAIPRLTQLLKDKAFTTFLARKVPFGVNGETFQQRASLAYSVNDVDTLKAIVAAFDKSAAPKAKTPGFSEPPASNAATPQRQTPAAPALTQNGLKLLNQTWREGKLSEADYRAKLKAYDQARAAGTLV
jgi:hypothetical protein